MKKSNIIITAVAVVTVIAAVLLKRKLRGIPII